MTEIYNSLTKPELIMGLIVLLGAIFMALQKLGLVDIFRRGENGKPARRMASAGECPDPKCSANVQSICEGVDDLKVEFKDFKREIFKRMDRDSRRIAYISGNLGIKED